MRAAWGLSHLPLDPPPPSRRPRCAAGRHERVPAQVLQEALHYLKFADAVCGGGGCVGSVWRGCDEDYKTSPRSRPPSPALPLSPPLPRAGVCTGAQDRGPLLAAGPGLLLRLRHHACGPTTGARALGAGLAACLGGGGAGWAPRAGRLPQPAAPAAGGCAVSEISACRRYQACRGRAPRTKQALFSPDPALHCTLHCRWCSGAWVSWRSWMTTHPSR